MSAYVVVQQAAFLMLTSNFRATFTDPTNFSDFNTRRSSWNLILTRDILCFHYQLMLNKKLNRNNHETTQKV